MALGLALLGLGFVFLVIGGSKADTGVMVSPLWLVAAFTFHTWGELCLSPVGLSYVTKVAPVRFASLLMGVWFLANGVADKIAGWLASFTPTEGAVRPEMSGLAGVVQSFSSTHATKSDAFNYDDLIQRRSYALWAPPRLTFSIAR
jgi:POT family proton-dependent oligopeptide transporter